VGSSAATDGATAFSREKMVSSLFFSPPAPAPTPPPLSPLVPLLSSSSFEMASAAARTASMQERTLAIAAAPLRTGSERRKSRQARQGSTTYLFVFF